MNNLTATDNSKALYKKAEDLDRIVATLKLEGEHVTKIFLGRIRHGRT